MPESTEIALLPPDDSLPTLYDDEAVLKAKVAEVCTNVRKIVVDEGLTADTQAGREALRSLAYRVSQGKSKLLKTADALTADARAAVKRVTTLKTYAETELDALRDETKAPAVEWDRREEERKDAIAKRLADLDRPATPGLPAADYRASLESMLTVETDATWGEFIETAAEIKARRLAELQTLLVNAKQAEKDRAELERFRAAEAQRQADAEAAAAAERKAAQEAQEAAAAAEREAQAQRDREAAAEAARAAAEAAAQAEIEAAKERERQAEARAESARRESEVERERAVIREQEAAARAAEAERKRAADEAAAAQREQAKRDANKKLRAKAKAEIVAAVEMLILGKTAPTGAADIADALLDGKIPHVTVSL